MIITHQRGVAQAGSAPGLGPGGREFESLRPRDIGIHTVCAYMTEDFLEFSSQKGNDLSTPRPEFSFPGLKEGDSWCLCAERWKEAYEFGKAPRIYLRKTHKKTLEIINIEILKEFALDLD